MITVKDLLARVNRIKRNTWILWGIAFALLGPLCMRWVDPDVTSQTILSTIGAVSALGFFVISNSLETARFQRELFIGFNARYDELNDRLFDILDTEKTAASNTLASEHAKTLEDYFNLCGEEFYYYRKGYVDGEVWQNWVRGMYWWFRCDDRIAVLWRNELDKNSYYGLSVEVLQQGSS